MSAHRILGLEPVSYTHLDVYKRQVEDLDVRDGEGERRERRLDQPGVLPGPGGVADDLPVVELSLIHI